MNYTTSSPTKPCELLNNDGTPHGCVEDTIGGSFNTFTGLANFLFSILLPIILVGGFTCLVYLRRQICSPAPVPVLFDNWTICDKLPEETENKCPVCYNSLFGNFETPTLRDEETKQALPLEFHNLNEHSDTYVLKTLFRLNIDRSTPQSSLPFTNERLEPMNLSLEDASTALSYQHHAQLNTVDAGDTNSNAIFVSVPMEVTQPSDSPTIAESSGEKVVMLPCKHAFHHTCIETWTRKHRNCPMCRLPSDIPI